ncbi:MAG: hypothetical protein WC975_06590 [Phycisphaerae bacterium]
MTIPQSAKEHFLVLRADGKTYHEISQQLKVSKRTLIEWGKELKSQIENLKALRLEVLQEKYYILKEKRIELFGQNLQSLINELSRRRLDRIPTAKLFDLIIKYTAALKKDDQPLTLNDETAPISQTPATQNP